MHFNNIVILIILICFVLIVINTIYNYYLIQKLDYNIYFLNIRSFNTCNFMNIYQNFFLLFCYYIISNRDHMKSNDTYVSLQTFTIRVYLKQTDSIKIKINKKMHSTVNEARLAAIQKI